ncbi:MAG TPA: hypothetical protein VHC44_02690, partial [Verrucomicrobiae bacterium]|nr:hypothetical protein [Verrucomicrobiae bacterium]
GRTRALIAHTTCDVKSAKSQAHQVPEKLQAPSANPRVLFEIWSFSGAWMLKLGAFAPILPALAFQNF